MGTIADKLSYTKQAREEIRAAIVDKGVECPGDAPFCTFDAYISRISGGSSNPVIKDIFNHGDVVGLNPLLTPIIQKQTQTSSWTVSTDKIYIPYTANANIVFAYPLNMTGCKYLCFEADASGKNGNYNVSTVGLRKWSAGLPKDYYGCTNVGVNLTAYSNQTNYAGTSPWYNLSRQVVRVPVETLTEPYMLCMHCCDCGVNIYSIWLE